MRTIQWLVNNSWFLWSTKENDLVHINDVEWKPKGTPGFDDEGAIQIDGMVCAWWFDGSMMHDEIIAKVCDMVVLPSKHASWPGDEGEGGGAVVPLLDGDCSMGMFSDRSQFWLNLDLDHEAIQSIRLKMTPWNPAMSTAREATATYLGSLGYDILRLHGTKTNGTIDGKEVTGTAYFQKSVFKHRAYHGIGAYCTFPMGRTLIGSYPILHRQFSVEIPKHGEDAM